MTHHASHRSPIAPRDAGAAAWPESGHAGDAGNAPARFVGIDPFMRLIAAH